MSDLDSRVRDLEIGQAKQGVVMEQMAKVVQDNTDAITALTEALNKGKGAVSLFNLAASAGVGGFLVAAFNYFKG